jgi:electron transfer flavoprotein alpha subunit
METILFLSPTEAGSPLLKNALEALATTKQLADSLGTTFSVGLWGDAPKADDIASCGADKFYAVAGAEFAQPRYATDAAAAEALCRAAGATIVIGPSGSRWNRISAGVAHRLGGRADSHVTGLSVSDGAPAIARWYYRQRMEGILTRAQRPWLLAVESGIAPAWQGAPGTAAIELISCTPSASRSNVTGIEALTADQQTIRPDAELLFVTGAGWTKKQPDGKVKMADAESLILGFIRLSRASLGSTKSLVDLSGEGQATLTFLTHMNQVGQTGSTPRHAKGLSTCCHGEEPHTVGWRFIGERRAISLDANCGWARGKADVLYVADAFAVMEKVNDLLAKKAGG